MVTQRLCKDIFTILVIDDIHGEKSIISSNIKGESHERKSIDQKNGSPE